MPAKEGHVIGLGERELFQDEGAAGGSSSGDLRCQHHRRFPLHWTAKDADLLDRFVQSRDWIWRQYVKFNPGGVGGHDWGLLARFAGEADLLAPAIRKCLATTLVTMDSFIETGIDMAVRQGELSPDAPKHALVLQISSLLHTSRHTTRIEGNFDRLDELLRWTLDVIQRAYGTGTPTRAWPPVVSVQARGRRRGGGVRLS